MTTLENIRDALPGYARDLQLNLGTVLTPAGAPGLSERQIWAVALAAAAASRNPSFSLRLQALAARHRDAAHERQLRQHGLEREAVQSAVRIAATVHAVARVLESVSGEKPLGASQAA